ncbi:hypothetical protein EfmE1636_2399 [Enterococcus faecium E1636]|nr:hypothetical protein EfmE1636_2399 [Enterococcus faecium E1636]
MNKPKPNLLLFSEPYKSIHILQQEFQYEYIAGNSNSW